MMPTSGIRCDSLSGVEAFILWATISRLAYCFSQLIHSGRLIRIGSDESSGRILILLEPQLATSSFRPTATCQARVRSLIYLGQGAPNHLPLGAQGENPPKPLKTTTYPLSTHGSYDVISTPNLA
jgi:hypothetical protein